MRRIGILMLALLALLTSCIVVQGQTFDQRSHVLIGQNPQGFVCGYQPDFAAGCASFSSSTVNVLFPVKPVTHAQFRAEIVAHTDEDRIRLRAFRWRWTAATGWTTDSVVLCDVMAPVLGAPRSVGCWLDPQAWNSAEGQWTFVFEIKGQPRVFGAQIIETRYEP